MAESNEEYLQSITIGDAQPFNRTVDLAPYDAAWPSWYETLAEGIRQALGDQVLRLEHVGSTAIPGLQAKPIIDMILLVDDSSIESAYVPALTRSGYRLHIREPEWHEHRLLKAPTFDGNLHVFSWACPEVDRMIVFRDWLRSNEDDRLRYEAEKVKLASRVWRYRQHYADAKSEVVQDILARADAAGAA